MIKFSELQAGKWYCPVFIVTDFNGEQREDVGGFYKYHGDKEFSNEDGETVDGFYDPDLGCYVAVDAPDGFAQ